MDPEKLAEWLREEHETVHELSVALQQAVAVEPRGEFGSWLKQVRGQFSEFHAHVQRHFALEEEDGYLLPVMERRPTFANHVAQLREEHRQIESLLDDLNSAAEELRPDQALIAGDWCVRVRHLLANLARHEHLEDLLVTLVFTQDIGTKD